MPRMTSKIRHEMLNILLCIITLFTGMFLLWCMKERLHGTNILLKMAAIFIAFAIPTFPILLAMRIFRDR
jgi:hypothetical protein